MTILESFLFAKEEVLKWNNLLQDTEIDDNGDFEVTLFSSKHVAQINLRKLDFLFVIIQIERKTFEYPLNVFNDLSQIKEFIISFLTGQYYYYFDDLYDVPVYIQWKSKRLNSLNILSDKTLFSNKIDGLVW